MNFDFCKMSKLLNCQREKDHCLVAIRSACARELPPNPEPVHGKLLQHVLTYLAEQQAACALDILMCRNASHKGDTYRLHPPLPKKRNTGRRRGEMLRSQRRHHGSPEVGWEKSGWGGVESGSQTHLMTWLHNPSLLVGKGMKFRGGDEIITRDSVLLEAHVVAHPKTSLL